MSETRTYRCRNAHAHFDKFAYSVFSFSEKRTGNLNQWDANVKIESLEMSEAEETDLGHIVGDGPNVLSRIVWELVRLSGKRRVPSKWSLWKPRSQEHLKVNNLHAMRSSIHPSLHPCSRFNSHASWRNMLWNKTVPVSELHFMWNLLSSKSPSFHKRNISSSQLQHIIILSNSTQPKLQVMMNVYNSWHIVLPVKVLKIIVRLFYIFSRLTWLWEMTSFLLSC